MTREAREDLECTRVVVAILTTTPLFQMFARIDRKRSVVVDGSVTEILIVVAVEARGRESRARMLVVVILLMAADTIVLVTRRKE